MVNLIDPFNGRQGLTQPNIFVMSSDAFGRRPVCALLRVARFSLLAFSTILALQSRLKPYLWWRTISASGELIRIKRRTYLEGTWKSVKYSACQCVFYVLKEAKRARQTFSRFLFGRTIKSSLNKPRSRRSSRPSTLAHSGKAHPTQRAKSLHQPHPLPYQFKNPCRTSKRAYWKISASPNERGEFGKAGLHVQWMPIKKPQHFSLLLKF